MAKQAPIEAVDPEMGETGFYEADEYGHPQYDKPVKKAAASSGSSSSKSTTKTAAKKGAK